MVSRAEVATKYVKALYGSRERHEGRILDEVVSTSRAGRLSSSVVVAGYLRVNPTTTGVLTARCRSGFGIRHVLSGPRPASPGAGRGALSRSRRRR